ncbi:uncharacterized protein LOC108738499 [Agrilus planipennis]|uniref:Uncharacterized protein LOC108738499 n=1 Tax=Agrilus planipennis TaxID=224129 RepID=A0A1W4X4X9_AGRPL|nr:uncharacterized protein LOC108738499 [Agrilus planipennis]XP_018327438.1 uncharacterized protein LOC108738499 [Agrilus planipennis]XP_018327439.1 uncharacterized protein LOC108738499 [Agrilus planipennis]XP_018327440.1 uncharacterized protein LOC108738499 [Agrilus planipennis]XP_018327441.1 uncharacterized protein LOC108738499 [Agrilus planipennis]
MKILFFKLLCLVYAINNNSVIGYNKNGYVSKNEYMRPHQKHHFGSSSDNKIIESPLYKNNFFHNRISTTEQPIKIRHSHHPHLDGLISKMTRFPSTATVQHDKTDKKDSTEIEDGFGDDENDNDDLESLAPDYDEWEEKEETENDNDFDDEDEELDGNNGDDDYGSWQAEEAPQQSQYPYQSQSQNSPFTQFKWDTFGSWQNVEKARRQLLENSNNLGEINRTIALQHVRKIFYESKCRVPYAKIISVQDIHPDSRKTYTPRCTKLYRCAEDTGCCENHQICGMKNQEIVELYFFIKTVGDEGNKIEKLSFYNHTECACLDRANATVKSRSNSEPGQGDMPRITGLSVLRPTKLSPAENIKRCKCPAEYKPRFQHYYLRCHCDCYEGNVDCLRMKRGNEYFSLKDRLCIKNSQCGTPACEYGSYQHNLGRCPKHHEQRNNVDD